MKITESTYAPPVAIADELKAKLAQNPDSCGYLISAFRDPDSDKIFFGEHDGGKFFMCATETTGKTAFTSAVGCANLPTKLALLTSLAQALGLDTSDMTILYMAYPGACKISQSSGDVRE